MATLSKNQEKTAKILKPSLNHRDNIYDLSCRQLRSLDMTLVLAAYGSLTSVNLSNNLLIALPESFGRVLGHIKYLDLSNNRLQKLPENFGLLHKLHTLILYQNKLRTLPVSFGTLEKLRWLDVAANPWSQCMRQVFGEDITQCATVAKNVREFFFLVQNAAENCTEPEPADEVLETSTSPKFSSPRIGDADQIQTQDELNEMTLDFLRETQETRKFSSNGDTNHTMQESQSFYKFPEAETKQQRQIAQLSKASLFFCFILILLTVSTTAAWLHGPPKSLLKNGSMRAYEWIPQVVVDSMAWVFWCTIHQLGAVLPHSFIDPLSKLLVVPRHPTVLDLMFGV
jgi:hypothetical protein